MNQQANQPTEQAPQTEIKPPEVTSLGSQESVVANIGEIFDDPTPAQPSTEHISPVVPIKEAVPRADPKVETPPIPTAEINPSGQQIETLAEKAPASSPTVETPSDNLLINPLEPVLEEEAPSLRDPASTAALHQDIQKMIKEDQFAGAEQEVIHERIENTRKVSLS